MDYSAEVREAKPNLRAAALAYAANAIPVFPLKVGGKTPLTSHGFKDATLEPDQIRWWWSRWPDANIGIPTGKHSGLLVVDVDPYNDGYYTLAELDGEGHRLPDTRLVWTGRGGQHYYLEYAEGEDVRNGKLGPGIDIKGEGGYVVVPPSVTTEPYKILRERPLAPTPEWLLERLRRPSRASEVGPGVQRSAARTSGGFPGSDEELLEAARNHRKTGALFSDLFDHGDAIPIGERSEADLALCDRLAFWTDCDPERMKKLFRESALARGKYQEKGHHAESYLDGRVQKAIRDCRETYTSEYVERIRAESIPLLQHSLDLGEE